MRQPNPIHPGRILREKFLKPAEVSQRGFAHRLGWTTAKLNELPNAKRGVTATSGLDLATRLETSPAPGLMLQMPYDRHRAQCARDAT